MDSCSGSCSSCTLEKRTQEFEKTKKDFQEQSEFIYNEELYSHPTVIMLSVTDACNFSCPYCFVHQHPKNMTLATAEQAVKWLYSQYQYHRNPDKMRLNFFGGEPLLRFDDLIVPIVEKYHNDIHFGITTNGSLLTEDVVDFLYKYDIQPLLSFDGVEVVQNSQRPMKNGDSFKTVLDNIQYLLLRFPNTCMRATLTKDSMPYMYESFLMAEELGFNTCTFCPNAYEEWGESEEILLNEQLEKIGLHIYKQFFNGHNSPTVLFDPLIQTFQHLEGAIQGKAHFNNSLLRCGLGTTACAVNCDGDIVPCQEKTSDPTAIIGNVWDGIDPEKHKAFLTWYWENINNIKCHDDAHCSERDRILCLMDTCPSRLEDQDFIMSSSICIFTRCMNKMAMRFHFLCGDSPNANMTNYLNRGVRW